MNYQDEQEYRNAYAEDDSEPILKPEYDETESVRIARQLTANLILKREQAIIARTSSGIEQIWREDARAYDGVDSSSHRMIDHAAQTTPPERSNSPRRSRVEINVIRGKVETAEGRFSDILLPTDDRNWGLKCTPKPEAMEALKDPRPAAVGGKPVMTLDGKQADVGDIAASDIEDLKKKMTAMEDEIDDQLNECSFNSICREVIQDAVRKGTGVMAGPNVVKGLKRSWTTASEGGTKVEVLEYEEIHKPASRRVDCWDVWPDPDCGEDVKMASYFWERQRLRPRDLLSYVGIEGYNDEAILEVLKQDPTRLIVAPRSDEESPLKYEKADHGYYEAWIYSGDLDREDLESMGVSCESIDSMLKTVSAVVVIVNDLPIKVMLNPLDTGDLPYDFFVWSKISHIPWGQSLVRQLIWQQRVLTSAWRAMMDNAGDSAGANIILGRGVMPADDSWIMGALKLSIQTGDQDDMNKAFAQFQIQNNQEQLQAIIEMALRFMDMETSIPMIFQGEQGKLPETLGATNILVDSNNVALRARVKKWDDCITRPHLQRYYDWNMQYNPKAEIKGDYAVDARGVSVLLARDQELQDIKEMLSMRGDPELSDMIDWEICIRQIMRGRHMDVILPDERIEENKRARAKQPAP
ncbi:MAG: hypothetical protein KJ604_20190, partial [Gammaproteobacteria bacterium]|nr:hypothetical protein [Gammaproteobacteria bacterium]